MAWSEQTTKALRRWLGPETWYKSHPLDDARFSIFIACVWNDNHSTWDEPVAREVIGREAVELHPRNDDLAKEVAEKRVAEGTTILEFLCHLREQGQLSLLSS